LEETTDIGKTRPITCPIFSLPPTEALNCLDIFVDASVGFLRSLPERNLSLKVDVRWIGKDGNSLETHMPAAPGFLGSTLGQQTCQYFLIRAYGTLARAIIGSAIRCRPHLDSLGLATTRVSPQPPSLLVYICRCFYLHTIEAVPAASRPALSYDWYLTTATPSDLELQGSI
jgi:hypothetical protein